MHKYSKSFKVAFVQGKKKEVSSKIKNSLKEKL